jgi:hypothetical protein
MKPTSLGDDFKACYYARDPVLLDELVKKIQGLEEGFRMAQSLIQELALKKHSELSQEIQGF